MAKKVSGGNPRPLYSSNETGGVPGLQKEIAQEQGWGRAVLRPSSFSSAAPSRSLTSNSADVPKLELSKRTLALAPDRIVDLYVAGDVSSFARLVIEPEVRATSEYLSLLYKAPGMAAGLKPTIESLIDESQRVLGEAPETMPTQSALFHLRVARLITDGFRERLSIHLNQRSDASFQRLVQAVESSAGLNHWLLPTWSSLSRRDFNDLQLAPIFPIGISYRAHHQVDGRSLTTEGFAGHDLGHYISARYPGIHEFWNLGDKQKPIAADKLQELTSQRRSFVHSLRSELAGEPELAEVFEVYLFYLVHEAFELGAAPVVDGRSNLPRVLATPEIS